MVKVEVDLVTFMVIVTNIITVIGSIVGLYVKINNRITTLELQVKQLCRHVDTYYDAWTKRERLD